MTTETQTGQLRPALNAATNGGPAHLVTPPHQSFWVWVLCLTGVDYFSTLGYQPSIAFEATGRLSPLATVILVLVTLFGAVPVYRHVAGSSPGGHGSIGMLEGLVHGWTGKFLVLTLLGFAATDFVITKTLSSADAAEHLIHNPFWKEAPEILHQQMVVTMSLLVALGVMFLRGFREVLWLAVTIVFTYIGLNAILIGSSLFYLAGHPSLFSEWLQDVNNGNWHLSHVPLEGQSWVTIILLSLLFFPKLALGLSGFETGVIVMPLIRSSGNTHEEIIKNRVRDARKLLLTAAVIMSLLLMGSSLVTTTLIKPEELRAPTETHPGGRAANRALAYLAHGESGLEISPLFGDVFGTIYDISTVAILWFAGASAMSGLLNLVPQYLPRYGMAPEWARAIRPLVLLFTGINLAVTWIFDAEVNAQADAYATGVVVLMLSAAFATVIELWRKNSGSWWRRLHWGYAAVTAIFLYTAIAIVFEKPTGIKIAGCFIAAVIVSSFVSRTMRSTELRFHGFQYKDETSRFLWDSMRHIEFPILVPHRPGRRRLEDKEESMREEHHLTGDIPLVFIEAVRGDVSEFYQSPVLEVTEREGRITLRITRCASIAHVIAAVALELSKVGKPPEIHFGWSDETPLAANIGFVLFGEGNIPWMVRELILKAEPNPERQPRVVVG